LNTDSRLSSALRSPTDVGHGPASYRAGMDRKLLSERIAEYRERFAVKALS
jgi:hypothetical protein